MISWFNKAVSAAALLVGAGVALGGCNSQASDICKAKCDCESCSQAEEDDCYSGYDYAKEVASNHGCDDVFDTLAQCEADKNECSNSKVSYPKCQDELNDYTKCVK